MKSCYALQSVFHIEDFVGCPLFIRGINNINKIYNFFAQVNKRNLTQCMYHNSSLRKWHRSFKFTAALSHLMHCQVKLKKWQLIHFNMPVSDLMCTNQIHFWFIGLWLGKLVYMERTFWKFNLPHPLIKSMEKHNQKLSS